jgi:hypothetical protein
MRKVIFMAAAAVMVAMNANAQSDNTQKPHAETTQSVSLEISPTMGASLHYGYELPIARRATIIGRIGANAGGEWGTSFYGDYGYWMVAPSIDIEPRFYYGLDRRAAHGRSTAGNAGSFLALQIKNIPPFGYVSDSRFAIYGATTFTPMWGIRRVWSENWLFEFTAGYAIGKPWGSDGIAHAPHLGVRFGYSF